MSSDCALGWGIGDVWADFEAARALPVVQSLKKSEAAAVDPLEAPEALEAREALEAPRKLPLEAPETLVVVVEDADAAGGREVAAAESWRPGGVLVEEELGDPHLCCPPSRHGPVCRAKWQQLHCHAQELRL